MAWYKAGGGSKPKQTKTVTPSTGVQEITADSGKELEKVTVQAMPSGALKTPTVNASGLVTSGVQTSGYIGTGTEKTLQLTTKSAQTYYPTTSDQTIPSGRYTTGVQTIKGDANLKAENIKSGKSIFGINGSAPVTTIDGVESTENLELKLVYKDVRGSAVLPASNSNGDIIVYNDALYFLPSYSAKGRVYRLADDESAWTQVLSTSDGLSNSYGTCGVVYNGKMHLIGGLGASSKQNFAYDGTSLVRFADTPEVFYTSRPCVYKNKIHIWCNGEHYSFDGQTWTLVDTTPSAMQYSSNVIAETIDDKVILANRGGSYAFSWDDVNGYNAITFNGTTTSASSWQCVDMYKYKGNLWWIYGSTGTSQFLLNDNKTNFQITDMGFAFKSSSNYPTSDYFKAKHFNRSIHTTGLNYDTSKSHYVFQEEYYERA